MNTPLTEQELISAIAKRELAGASALYEQYAATLYKIIFCSVRDQQIAAAVLEETLSFVWNNCNDCLQQDKRLLLWMAGIARGFARKKVSCK